MLRHEHDDIGWSVEDAESYVAALDIDGTRLLTSSGVRVVAHTSHSRMQPEKSGHNFHASNYVDAAVTRHWCNRPRFQRSGPTAEPRTSTR